MDSATDEGCFQSFLLDSYAQVHQTTVISFTINQETRSNNVLLRWQHVNSLKSLCGQGDTLTYRQTDGPISALPAPSLMVEYTVLHNLLLCLYVSNGDCSMVGTACITAVENPYILIRALAQTQQGVICVTQKHTYIVWALMSLVHCSDWWS